MIFLEILNIATVEDILLEKWWHAKTHFVKESGSILFASRRKISLRNGTVLTVKNSVTKLRIPIQEVILLTKNLQHEINDMHNHFPYSY